MSKPIDTQRIAGNDALVISQGGKVQAIYDVELQGSYYHIFVARRDNVTHDYVYAVSATSLSAAAGYIERSIARGYPDSQRTLVREQTLIDFTNQNKDLFDIQIKSEGSTAPKRVKKAKPETTDQTPSETHVKNEQQKTENPAAQQDRAATKQADNNLTENLKQNTVDESPIQNNNSRSDKTEPATEAGKNESLGDRADREVSEFFGNGQRAASVLKGQLEEYVLEGGDPILGALGATGLDVMNLAMGFAEGTALGLLDTRNLGQGIKKGTFEGVKEDAGRLLNILPQGKVARALGTVLTVSDMAEAAADHDAAGFASGGFGFLPGGGKGGKGKKKQKHKKGQKGGSTGSSSKQNQKQNQDYYEHGIDPHTVTDIKKNRERHHAVLQALFRRLNDNVLASFIHEGPSHPITLKLHKKIHRELNEMLRKEGFLERRGQPRTSLSPADFKRALQKIEEFYQDKSLQHPNISELREMRETVRTFRRSLENIGLI